MISKRREDGIDYLSIACDCPGCETFLEFPEHFAFLIDKAKQGGWRIFKHDGDWVHECPACIRKL